MKRLYTYTQNNTYKHTQKHTQINPYSQIHKTYTISNPCSYATPNRHINTITNTQSKIYNKKHKLAPKQENTDSCTDTCTQTQVT